MNRHLALAFAEGDTIHAFVLDMASWEEAYSSTQNGRYKGVQIVISSKAGHTEVRRTSTWRT